MNTLVTSVTKVLLVLLLELDLFASFLNLIGITFNMWKLDLLPFNNSYSKNGSNSEVNISIWDLPITDLHGIAVHLLFYVLQVNGFLLLGNDIMHKYDLLYTKDLFLILPGQFKLPEKNFIFAVYFELVISTDPKALRTSLMVLPKRTLPFQVNFWAGR